MLGDIMKYKIQKGKDFLPVAMNLRTFSNLDASDAVKDSSLKNPHLHNSCRLRNSWKVAIDEKKFEAIAACFIQAFLKRADNRL
jgi:hypothetical protein